MSANKEDILTPAGRLVSGDCFEPQKTDAEGRPLVIKNGPNAGQPRVDYFMGLAIPKTDPEFGPMYAKILGVAKADFPTLFDAAGNCINPKFAFKVTDGDSTVPNTKGVAPVTREGYAGHWVLHFSGGFAPKCYTAGGAEQIMDASQLKRGDYIRIYGSVKGNGSMQQPGVYLNHSMVERVGFGEAITSGPSGEAVFGSAPAANLPAGASATPVAPTTPMAQPAAVSQVPAAIAAIQPAAVAPVVAPVVQPAAVAPVVTPAPDFLNAPTPAPAAAPVAQVEKSYIVQGTAYPESALRAQGYTDAHFATLPVAP